MTLINALDGKTGVVIDTMVFIYLFEDHKDYAGRCEKIIDRMGKGFFSGVVTPITAAEVLVKPLQNNRASIADRYRYAIRNLPNVTFSNLDMEIAFMAGSFRAKYGMPLPDMFQAATALRFPAHTLITNDLSMTKIQEIDIFLLEKSTE